MSNGMTLFFSLSFLIWSIVNYFMTRKDLESHVELMEVNNQLYSINQKMIQKLEEQNTMLKAMMLSKAEFMAATLEQEKENEDHN